MVERLEGKVAIVTGGASGIGQATALAFAREGAKLVVADVDSEGGKETVSLINAAGGGAVFVESDVRSPDQVEAIVSKAVETYGGLDYAFNNAGVLGTRASTTDCSTENWEHVVGVNLTGVWLCMKYEISEMLRRGGGAIVNNSSIEGLRGLPGFGPYVASKHGVIGLTRAAALEFGPHGIRINAVCPGTIPTPMNQPHILEREGAGREGPRIAMGRTGSTGEVADAVLWLCSGASFVTGSSLVVDGGETAGWLSQPLRPG